MRQKRASAGSTSGLVEMLRDMIAVAQRGAGDLGEVLLAQVSDTAGAAVEAFTDNKWLRVRGEAVDDEKPWRATLFSPLNALWRKPTIADQVTILRPRNQDPASAIALWGDGGAANDVPADLDDNNTVLSPPTGDLLFQSRNGKLELKSNRTGATVATITLNTDGSLELRDAGGATATLDGTGNVAITAAAGKNVTATAGAGIGVAQVTASPVTGTVKLGPVGALQVLVQGAADGNGIPVTQAPAALLSIVKAG